jgi:hypothetical protein
MTVLRRAHRVRVGDESTRQRPHRGEGSGSVQTEPAIRSTPTKPLECDRGKVLRSRQPF